MKRSIISLLLVILFLFPLSSCASKYAPVKSSEDELRIVGYIDKYPVYYDELRCSVMNAKKVMGDFYGIDPDSEEFAKKYSEELKNRVFDGLKYNYAVQILFENGGYSIEDPHIQEAVQEKITELIDECGSKRKYIEYLEENYLTDRLQRFNIAISYASSELLYLLNDSGALLEYVDFDFTAIRFGDIYFTLEDYSAAMDLLYAESVLINTEYVFIPSSVQDHKQLADVYLTEASGGKALEEIAKGNPDTTYKSLHIVEGTRDKNYFDAAKALSHEDITCISTDSGSFVIKRLELDQSYVNNNYYELIYTYLSVKVSERTDAYADSLELVLTEFGKSLDIINIR